MRQDFNASSLKLEPSWTASQICLPSLKDYMNIANWNWHQITAVTVLESLHYLQRKPKTILTSYWLTLNASLCGLMKKKYIKE